MDPLHKRFSDDQARLTLQAYCQGLSTGAEIQGMPGVSDSESFALLKQYRQDPTAFSAAHSRVTPAKLSAAGLRD